MEIDQVCDQGANASRWTAGVKSTLLRYAAKYGIKHFAQYLIHLGADVDAQNSMGETLLTLAVRSRKKRAVQTLLKAGADVEAQNSMGETPLILAVSIGRKRVVEMLLEAGANVDAQNLIGETALMLAVRYENERIVELLMKAGADLCAPNNRGQCVLGEALKIQETLDRSIVPIIFNSITTEFISTSPYVKTEAFHVACPLYGFLKLKNAELTRVLLENGSPVDAIDPETIRTSLHLAVEELDVEHVKLLVEYHADVNARDRKTNRPLALISDYNKGDEVLEIVKILINAGAATFFKGDEFELVAASLLSNGNKEIIHTVLQSMRDIDFHMKDKFWKSVLDYLCENNNPGVFEELRNFKIDFNTSPYSEMPQLQVAAREGNANAAVFLLKRGADINAKGRLNFTPLQMAFATSAIERHLDDTDVRRMRRLNCIEILLQYGADPHVFTEDSGAFIEIFNDEVIKDGGIDLMRPVLNHLALLEASGRVIERFMLSEIEKRPAFKTIFNSSKQQLEELKRIEIGESANLFDFLIAKQVWPYVHNEILISNGISSMEESIDSYYYRVLQKSFLRLTRVAAINEVFLKFHNVSAGHIVDKIVNYL